MARFIDRPIPSEWRMSDKEHRARMVARDEQLQYEMRQESQDDLEEMAEYSDSLSTRLLAAAELSRREGY